MKLAFKDIEFIEKEDRIELIFLREFYTFIDKEDLEEIGQFKVMKNSITIQNKESAQLFSELLSESFTDLRNRINNNKTIYIHKNSGIPLIGNISFGIVDRGTNIIEVKPITGCNINCVFCSVNEGLSSKKLVDFVVEKDYLVQELKKVIEEKELNKEKKEKQKIDIFINTHGEALIYADLAELIADMRKIKQIGTIALITNGTLLTEELADRLIDAGLTQVNLSINSIDDKTAKRLAGTAHYDIENIKKAAKHIQKKIRLVIAPVYIKGVNDAEIEKIILFAKEIGCENIGIQNYYRYKGGKKIAKEMKMNEFFQKLEELEKKHKVNLTKIEHTYFKTKPLRKPFKKGAVVNAEIVCEGRMPDERIAVAENRTSSPRTITLPECKKDHGRVRIKITGDKHNIFYGKTIR